MDTDGREAVIEKRFKEHVKHGLSELSSLKYKPAVFQNMISMYGEIDTTKRLLASEGPENASGLARLWDLGRLDLSVEYAVCLPWFRELFTEEEFGRAGQRLTGLSFPWEQKVHAERTPHWYAELAPAEPGDDVLDAGDALQQAGESATAGASYRQQVEALEAAQAAGGPATRTALTIEAVRSERARRSVMVRSSGHCENPECASPDFVAISRTGDFIVEIDHIQGLAEGGPDHPVNMIALCPNCHAVKTRGRDEEVSRLRALLTRTARERHEAAMRRE